jgi:DNA-binding HxlR family transcriptional regulator
MLPAAPGEAPDTPADARDCAAMRMVLDRVGNRWSLIVVEALSPAPLRFNQLRRKLDGISQRMLTLTLRNLERDGLVTRTVLPGTPPGIDYALTQLGLSLHLAAQHLLRWAEQHRTDLEAARAAFDRASNTSS